MGGMLKWYMAMSEKIDALVMDAIPVAGGYVEIEAALDLRVEANGMVNCDDKAIIKAYRKRAEERLDEMRASLAEKTVTNSTNSKVA